MCTNVCTCVCVCVCLYFQSFLLLCWFGCVLINFSVWVTSGGAAGDETADQSGGGGEWEVAFRPQIQSCGWISEWLHNPKFGGNVNVNYTYTVEVLTDLARDETGSSFALMCSSGEWEYGSQQLHSLHRPQSAAESRTHHMEKWTGKDDGWHGCQHSWNICSIREFCVEF